MFQSYLLIIIYHIHICLEDPVILCEDNNKPFKKKEKSYIHLISAGNIYTYI